MHIKFSKFGCVMCEIWPGVDLGHNLFYREC